MLLTGFTLVSQGVTVLLLVLLFSVILRYHLRVSAPYAKLPSYRVDTRILYWVLTKKHLLSFFFHKMIDVSKQYYSEGMFVVWIGQPVLFIYGEEAVKTLVKEPAATDKPNLYKFFEFATGKSVFTSSGKRWKKQKKLISPAFRLDALKDKIPIMNENASALVQQLSTTKSNTTDESIAFIKACSIGIFYESGLGLKGNRNLDEEQKLKVFTAATEAVCEFAAQRVIRPWLYWDIGLHLFPAGRKFLKMYEEFYRISMKLLENFKASYISRRSSSESVNEDHGPRPKLFSEILIEEHLKDPTFSLKEVRDELILLTAAGHDTVSYTLMWCLILLGIHQDVQEKTYQEVLTSPEGDIQYDDLENFEYMENVIKETLRLYPVGPLFGRWLREDMQFGKYKVPKNISVFVFVYMLHRNPDIYPDPEKFDPDRFKVENSRVRQWNYIPFAEGIRSCPGKAFAMIELKILLAHILRNFKLISLDRREDIELSWELTLKSTKKLRMQFIPRHSLSSASTC